VIKVHLRPSWDRKQLTDIKPLAVQEWLKEFNLTPKSKQNIKAAFHHAGTCHAVGVDACASQSSKSR
jgi:hypothetical protein